MSVFPLIGCSEDDGGGGGTAGSGGTAGTGGTAGDGGSGGMETASVRFFIQTYEPGEPREGLGGVEICVTGTSNCEVTTATGNATLEMPVDEEVSYTMEKEGYASYLDSAVIPATGLDIAVGMATVQRLEDMHALVMSPYPPEGTGLAFVDTATAVEGVTFELLDVTGKAFYRDENESWSTELTATTSGGGGGFVEVSPGVVQIEFGGTGENCTLFRGWPGDSANRVKIPVEEGYLSRAILTCP